MSRKPGRTPRAAKNGFSISRRSFLALSGAGAAGIAVSGCGPQNISDFLELSESARRAPGGEEKSVTALCGQCTGGCSLRVRTVGGRAVSLTGNPFYPLNRNGVCPTGLAGLQVLYNPDRVHGPLKRAGSRGEGKWQSISWQEAIETTAQRLREIRARGEAHQVAFLSGKCPGLMDGLIARFCRAYGTPNDIRNPSAAAEAQALARYCMQGTRAPFTYDFDNTNCILSFGAPLFDAGDAPVRMMRAYGHLRQERPGPKAKIIQIEPRFSVTAAKADQWVPINPGTEATLALGIAYVLIREGLYDKAFVDAHTFGFDDWRDEAGRMHLGFRNLVLQDYNLDEVARITGVPVASILGITKEFAKRKPAIALGEMASTNALYSALAVHALNALVGSLDVPGGVVFPAEVPLKPWPELALDAVAEQGAKQARLDCGSSPQFPLARHAAQVLPANIVAERPYKAAALFLYATNPVFSSPAGARFAEAFAKVPFIVSFSPFIDESSLHADLILPDHTALERWEGATAPSAVPYALFGVGQPACAPLYDTMQSTDVLLQVARQIGGSTAAAFPWTDAQDVLRYRVAGLFAARRGAIVEHFNEQAWTALLEQRGWWSPSYQGFDEFWAQLQEKGGWWDPVYTFRQWRRIFETASGRFEFYSLALKKTFDELAAGRAPDDEAPLASLQLIARGDRLCLPHFEPPRFTGAAEQYPLHLNVMKILPLAAGGNANQPFLQEILGPQVGMRWDSWVEINPETAHERGIDDGERVWLESPAGKLEVRARLTPAAMPDVVNVPANLGHTAYGRWARGTGINPLEITASDYDYLAGLSASGTTRVTLYKA